VLSELLSYTRVSIFSSEFKTAIEYLLKGIKKAPSSALLYATLGEKYWAQGKETKALEQIELSIKRGFNINQYGCFEPYKTDLVN
jgi:hypothetical protein